MVEAGAFRDAMAQFAEPVTIVSTAGPGGHGGLTATSVASVSDDPPTVLVCLNRSGRSHGKIAANGVFCVNLLAADQRDLAIAFAARTDEPADALFAGSGWRPLETGAPVSREALVALDCRLVDSKDVGTHVVLFGRVVAIARGRERTALLYAGRTWRALDVPVPAP
jgi:flavin reductase